MFAKDEDKAFTLGTGIVYSKPTGLVLDALIGFRANKLKVEGIFGFSGVLKSLIGINIDALAYSNYSVISGTYGGVGFYWREANLKPDDSSLSSGSSASSGFDIDFFGMRFPMGASAYTFSTELVPYFGATYPKGGPLALDYGIELVIALLL